MSRCLSTLSDLPEEGYSWRALVRLSSRRKMPRRLDITRADIPRIRADTAARMSISGVQDKISLRLLRGRLLPTDTGGEYLLKPIPSARLPELHDDVPANEHLTMQLAEQVFGIRAAASACIRLADEELAYITRRFDRGRGGRKIAQEDFCQLMGKSPASSVNYKYDSSYEELGEALRRYCAAYLVEVEELFRRIVFCYACSNGDAHLKNFSLQQGPSGDYLLSPAYDLVASSMHLPNEHRLALDLLRDDEIPLGVSTVGFETGADFLDLARRFGMRERRARAVIDSYASKQPAATSLIKRSFLSDEAKMRYHSLFEQRLAALALC